MVLFKDDFSDFENTNDQQSVFIDNVIGRSIDNGTGNGIGNVVGNAIGNAIGRSIGNVCIESGK